MNKKELIDSIAGATGENRRTVTSVLEATINEIQKQVKKGDKVTLPGFGTFSQRSRAARTARNPRTGEEIKVKAAKVPGFKAGAGFRDFVGGRKK